MTENALACTLFALCAADCVTLKDLGESQHKKIRLDSDLLLVLTFRIHSKVFT